MEIFDLRFKSPGIYLFGLMLLGLILGGLSGCLSASGNDRSSAPTYARGELDITVAQDFTRVVNAARQATTDLKFIKVSEKKDATSAVLLSRASFEKPVRISVTYTGNQLTNIKIRVGLIGDEQLSGTIWKKIKSGL